MSRARAASPPALRAPEGAVISQHGSSFRRQFAPATYALKYPTLFAPIEKFSTFLRVEVCVNRMKDLGLNKGLENLERLRRILVGVTDRFAGFEAQSLNVHVDFPLFQRIALPVTAGKTKIAGI